MSAPATDYTALRERFRGLLLDRLGLFARGLGMDQADWLTRFLDAAGQAHDELAGLRDRRGFEQAHGLTASRISLVQENDLEFTLELSELARRLRERSGTALVQLHLYYMSLLDQHDAAVEQTPVGPEAVCSALRALCDAAAFDADHRMRFIDRCAEPLGQCLHGLYRELNLQFLQAGVPLPSPDSLRSADTRSAIETVRAGSAGTTTTPAADERATALRTAATALCAPAFPLAERAERREHALVQATHLIKRVCKDDTPNAIRGFLYRYWLQLLARLHYSQGENHPQWQAAGSLAERLVRSAQSRDEWIAALPPLMRDIHRGLAALGLDENARQSALAPCMALHSALLAGRPPPPHPNPAPQPAVLSAPLGAHGLRVLHHDGFAAIQSGDQPAAAAGPGQWLDLYLPDNTRVTGCVAWTGPLQRLVVIADPVQQHLLAASRRALAELAEAGACRLLDGPPAAD